MNVSANTETPQGVRLGQVSKTFDDTVALANVSLEIHPGEFVSLLGPSGCGKTTLLRIVAGFEKPDSGTVMIGTADVTDMRPQRRPTAMVFQNYALFPSMTVGENVAYGLKVRKHSKSDRQAAVARALQRVGLEGLAGRSVAELSGGQQQRVALARAIAVEPAVLLYDEPLSNLDVALRERTRAELKALRATLGHTSIYVTHDQQEALGLSDRVAVMKEGEIVQVGSPEILYREPATSFVASFLGGANIVSDPQLQLELTGEKGPNGKQLAVRPEHLDMIDAPSEAGLHVESDQFLGAHREVWLATEGGLERLRVHWPVERPVPARPTARATVWNWVDPD